MIATAENLFLQDVGGVEPIVGYNMYTIYDISNIE